MTTDNLTWVAARASGLLGYLLVTASVALGLALSLKVRTPTWPRYVTTEVHRRVTLIALVFTLLHGITLWLDPYQAFVPGELLVPLASHYRPLWVALGIIAGDLALALYLSDRLRTRGAYPLWRRLHSLTFVAWILVTLHGLGSGADSRTPWAIEMYGVGTLLVVGLIVIRLWPFDGIRKPTVMALLALGLWLGGIWTVTGPLQAGWTTIANNGFGSGQAAVALDPTTAAAERDGNEAQGGGPATNLAGDAGPQPGLPAPVGSGAITNSFRATFVGRISQVQQADGTWLATIVGNLSGTVNGQMSLQGPQTATGALQSASLRLIVNDVGCDGTMRTGERGRLSATCTTAAGQRLSLQIQLQSSADGTVSGAVATTRGDD